MVSLGFEGCWWPSVPGVSCAGEDHGSLTKVLAVLCVARSECCRECCLERD